MKKNRLLNSALFISNVLKYIFILLIAAMTFVLIHWHFSPSTYKNIAIVIDKTGDTSYIWANNAYLVAPDATNPKINSNNKEWIQLTQINQQSLYTHYVQTAGYFILLILIINQITNIIGSVKILETFRRDNCSAFRKIGFYCLAIALLTFFKWYEIESNYFMSVSLKPIPLSFALGAFILAEIFKEGNKLYEAEQLTI
ncbi:DUF2975 domain-containing protein [Pontibacter sp. Tf4]|uniref:DUF2975 domain-containing protein n=1 Tax=Pontibacter sp. Tf4 TaxID=2761620 RepID=UPI001628D2AE|nr:DUF2975 domain-containing protein [Pontibacter sp. Tf4]MBB6610963.1 DUF2975 domain-containing protein [Pontibacter sp. Tf4]